MTNGRRESCIVLLSPRIPTFCLLSRIGIVSGERTPLDLLVNRGKEVQ